MGITPFLIIFTEISPYFEAEVPLFRTNLVRACGSHGHQSGRAGHMKMMHYKQTFSTYNAPL
jgi:hypothetical protein